MNFAKAVQVLADAGVDFVVIGGWSAILHGSDHTTTDIDFCYSRRSDNLKRLATALAPYHPRLRDLPRDLPFVWDESTLRNGAVFTLTTDLGAIDLLAEVSGVGDYDHVKADSILRPVFGREIWVLDLRALIRSKRVAGREKDLRTSWRPCSKPRNRSDRTTAV